MGYGTPFLEWQKSKTKREERKKSNAGKDADRQGFSLMAGRNAEWYSHFRNGFALSYKVKHRPSNHTSRWNI